MSTAVPEVERIVVEGQLSALDGLRERVQENFRQRVHTMGRLLGSPAVRGGHAHKKEVGKPAETSPYLRNMMLDERSGAGRVALVAAILVIAVAAGILALRRPQIVSAAPQAKGTGLSSERHPPAEEIAKPGSVVDVLVPADGDVGSPPGDSGPEAVGKVSQEALTSDAEGYALRSNDGSSALRGEQEISTEFGEEADLATEVVLAPSPERPEAHGVSLTSSEMAFDPASEKPSQANDDATSRPMDATTPTLRPSGAMGMSISEIDVVATAENPKGDIAFVKGPDGKGYFLHIGDDVYDGRIIAIDALMGTVTFRQRIDDPRAESHRDIVKRVSSTTQQRAR